MLMDYWLASWLGRAWLRLRASARPEYADMPGQCEAVARGQMLSASKLCKVQEFAIEVWWRAGMVPVVALVIGGIAAKILYGGAVPFALVKSVGSVLILLTGIAGAEITMLVYRQRRTRLLVLGSRFGSPRGGLPRRSDFWLALALGIAGTGVLLIAGFGSRPS